MQFNQLARRAAAAFVISCAVQPVLAQVAATGAPQEVKGWRAETVTDALPQAWGMAWLPDGRILVTGKELYTGNAFAQWRGSLFSGSLAGMDVRRVELDAGGKVVKQEKLAIGKRVRDVRQGPDGHLYVLTDESSSRILRIVPDKS